MLKIYIIQTNIDIIDKKNNHAKLQQFQLNTHEYAFQ